MTITLFVEPESLPIFLEVTRTLQDKPIVNDYIFNPNDLIFSEAMISNWVWINMDILQYRKLKYCMGELLTNSNKVSK
jgi:hypothetical protein